jgi:hypothetical protein
MEYLLKMVDCPMWHEYAESILTWNYRVEALSGSSELRR